MPDINTILAESSLYNALYSEAGQASNATANAKALTLSAQGQNTEASQYDTAQQISLQNAAIERVSGQIQQYQTSRNVLKVVGQQQAGYAGAGFANSGTALDVARSTLQQGVLENQVLGLNASLAAGGYFSQAASSSAEATTARTAASVSTANAAAASNLAQLSANSAVATKNFMSQIPGFDPNNPTGPAASANSLNNPFSTLKPAPQPWNNTNTTLNPATITPENINSILPNPASFNPQPTNFFNPLAQHITI